MNNIVKCYETKEEYKREALALLRLGYIIKYVFLYEGNYQVEYILV